MPRDENPYERWDIDPLGGPFAITERMRELVEDATDEAAKKAIRAAWEELTLHPARRFRAALAAHPEHPSALGRRPPPPRPAFASAARITAIDVVMRPSILSALGPSEEQSGARVLPARASEAELRAGKASGDPALPELPLDHDPILRT
jgi:hypothetical protein